MQFFINCGNRYFLLFINLLRHTPYHGISTSLPYLVYTVSFSVYLICYALSGITSLEQVGHEKRWKGGKGSLPSDHERRPVRGAASLRDLCRALPVPFVGALRPVTGHVMQNSGDDEGGHVLRLVTVLAPEVKYLKINDCKTHESFFCFCLKMGMPWCGKSPFTSMP